MDFILLKNTLKAVFPILIFRCNCVCGGKYISITIHLFDLKISGVVTYLFCSTMNIDFFVIFFVSRVITYSVLNFLKNKVFSVGVIKSLL